ncbi:MAG: glycoside hydrolase family 13 protein [Christensenellales bacterium]|jgi:cyclomaltodextrinase
MFETSLYHHSHNKVFRSPFGAVPEGTAVRLRLGLHPHHGVHSPRLLIWHGGEKKALEMSETGHFFNQYALYEAVLTPQEPGHFWYGFCAWAQDGHTLYWGDNPGHLGGEGWMYHQDDFPAYLLTVYKKDFRVPDWFKGGIMYQIFPDRFYKSESAHCPEKPRMHENWDEDVAFTPLEGQSHYCADDFFGGNLKGIEEKLPYLADLGVSILYLNPIFQSVGNHRYNTGDYEKIDETLGTKEDFIRLCRAAKDHGIAIILDGVFSHTGNISRYFNFDGRYKDLGAAQSQGSPYYRWYTFYQWPTKYECWWGDETLPNTRESDESYRHYMLAEGGIVRRWIAAGAMGWRLDVADELPDLFLSELYQAVKSENPQAVVMGEVWEDASRKEAYGHLRPYVHGHQMDTVMNYPLRNALMDFLMHKTDAAGAAGIVMQLKESYPPDFFHSLMNMTGTHDVPRVLSSLCGIEPHHGTPRSILRTMEPDEGSLARGKALLKLLATALFTLPGNVSIYYGDEAGMTGMRDPFNRRTYPWGREDQSLLAHFKALGHIRRSQEALCCGDLLFEDAGPDILAFRRFLPVDGEALPTDAPENNRPHSKSSHLEAPPSVITLINRSLHPQTAVLPSQHEKWRDLLTGDAFASGGGALTIPLPPLAGRILRAV